ncbi:DUF4253 domain-containing protein [Streptomyces rubiginosohelvolus]|uniref:DUF4253 domain-containing protein n=1 Tax=Streptomyces rubiginosohelvolus TaxID=67362 RepID=UPI003804F367
MPTGPWVPRANDPSRRPCRGRGPRKPVSLGCRSADGRPPVRVLAAEHYLVCPDVFHEDPDLDWSTYHEELMRLREWRFWWD